MAQSMLSSTLPAKEAHEFWTRHQWLAAAVEERLQRERERQGTSLSTASSTDPLDGNPMLTFTRMLAHDTVILLSDTASRIEWKELDHQLMAMACRQRAYEAGSDMVWLVQTVPHLGCFTVWTTSSGSTPQQN
jgi:hypothetical protein